MQSSFCLYCYYSKWYFAFISFQSIKHYCNSGNMADSTNVMYTSTNFNRIHFSTLFSVEQLVEENLADQIVKQIIRTLHWQVKQRGPWKHTANANVSQMYHHHTVSLIIITSCAARWPPQYAPARDLDFWPWSRCGSRMWPGVPLCKVSSS